KPSASPEPWRVHTPLGREVSVPVDTPPFELNDGPGIYEVRRASEVQRLAVNIPADESKTAPLDPEALAALGVRSYKDDSLPQKDIIAQRQTMQIQELESKQQGWRWLLLAALAVTLVETVYAGRIASREHVAS
ncbi:MAG TPA: hypothetical protein VHV77_04230, partial [Pirellulales bacterium]|nr:hypothetical protein [Pirellulales bacterium]